MWQKVGGRMSMAEVIEEIRRDPSVRYMQEPFERLKDGLNRFKEGIYLYQNK